MKKAALAQWAGIVFVSLLSACSKTSPSLTAKSDSTVSKPATVAPASSIGIGSGSTFFDLSDTRDLITPFDFYGTGKANQLICYRPGTRVIWMFNNTAASGAAPNFQRIFVSSTGLGASPNNYNLDDNRDKIIPYDLNGTGHPDHLICYRPGGGAFWIFSNNNGVFTEILRSSIGVGTAGNSYDLSDSRDIVVPFDFYGTGKATQLLCYRPGGKACWILTNTAAVGATPNFVPVYKTSVGIGESGSYVFDLSDSRDLIVPYDFSGSGVKNGIICYRPGTGVVYDYKRDNSNANFYSYFVSNGGIYNDAVFPAGLRYDFSSSSDRIAPYDYYSNGKTNNVVCYRPGGGVCYMFTNYTTDGDGDVVYNTTSGIGSGSTYYDLSNTNDKVFAYDYDGTGKIDHLVCYRPGGKAIWIFNNALQQIY